MAGPNPNPYPNPYAQQAPQGRPGGPPPEFTTDRPDDELVAATKHLHRAQGLRKVRRVGAEVHGTNHKGQLVITSIERADAHAAHLEANPHLFDLPSDDDQPEPPAE